MTLCKHGYDEDEDVCPECRKRRVLELEAEIEANWQRNVIGPMFGWDEEDEEISPREALFSLYNAIQHIRRTHMSWTFTLSRADEEAIRILEEASRAVAGVLK